ncbi:MAG: M48 family metallopeptidase [Proteobacteria bacterium]|nr:M48 family metallopeptidase [Burkholderiales bacterium]
MIISHPTCAARADAGPRAVHGLAARITHLDTDQIGTLDLDGRPVEYVLRRSLRRTRAMLSLSDRGLVLAVPLRMPMRSIEIFLEHSHPWLRRHLPRWRAHTAAGPDLTGLQRVLWFGESLAVHAIAGRTPGAGVPCVERAHDRVNVTVSDPHDPVQVRGQLRAWLQREALPWFEGRADHFAPLVGVSVPPLKLTNARTLWGSCTPAGLVRINWRLLQSPPRLIDYVIVHELAHLAEANHSSRFWAVVARAFPEHRAARRELTEWQRRLAVL